MNIPKPLIENGTITNWREIEQHLNCTCVEWCRATNHAYLGNGMTPLETLRLAVATLADANEALRRRLEGIRYQADLAGKNP